MKDQEKRQGSSFIEKVKPLVFPFIYLALTITLAISVFTAIKKRNYISIYIDGTSMQPTLNENVNHHRDSAIGMDYYYETEYGYADSSKIARDNIERFNVVITYYPSDYIDGKLKDKSDYKIKRVIAMPGETFSIIQSVLNIKDAEGNITFTCDFADKENRPFEISRDDSRHQKDHAEYTLKDNEYWVLGDNWNVSSDSHSVGAIKTEYIAGVLVAVQGTCTLVNGVDKNGKSVSKFIDYHKYSKPRFFI